MASRAPARTLLEQLVRDNDRTIHEWCQLFNTTAGQLRAKATLSARQLQRWMAGEVDGARPAARRVAAALWGCDFPTLVAPPAPLASPSAGNAFHEDGDDGAGAPTAETIKTTTTMAARESSRHAAAAGGGVSPASIDQVRAEVSRLARSYGDLPPRLLLAQARGARDLAYQVLDRTRKPAQTAELYLAAGQLCGLMAVASFDLAIWAAAAEQARAAQVYAELVGHAELRSWATGTLALIANWTGRPSQALALLRGGLDQAPAGLAQARLRCIEARAWAHLGGEPERVTAALHAADEALAAGHGGEDLHNEIGGQYGWSPGRHASCAGTALLTMGKAAAAMKRITTAITLLPDDSSGMLIAERSYIDLASADLALGQLDDAIEALDRIWRVPAPQRRHSLTQRLDDVAQVLRGRPWHRDRAATQLLDRIEVFNLEAGKGRAGEGVFRGPRVGEPSSKPR